MASVRLAIKLRNDIRHNAMNGAFENEFAAIERREEVVGDACYRLLVPEEFEKQMKKLPVGYLKTDTYFQFAPFRKPKQSGEYGSRMTFHLSKERRLPKFFESYSLELVVGDDLMNEIEAIETEKERLKNAKQDLRAKVDAILNSVGNVARLLVIWPEVEKFLPDYAINPKLTNLPAVLVGEVNAALSEAKHEELAVAA